MKRTITESVQDDFVNRHVKKFIAQYHPIPWCFYESGCSWKYGNLYFDTWR